MNKGLNICWPTFIQVGNVDNATLINSLADQIISTYDLNVGPNDLGWADMIYDSDKTITKFREEVVIPNFEEYLNKVYETSLKNYPNYRLRSWIASYKDGLGMVSHSHSGSQIGSVYYLMAENNAQGGEIVFTDPRGNSHRGYDDHFQKFFNTEIHMPSTGDYLIFPSYTFHHVQGYTSRLRIAMPIDLYLGENTVLDKTVRDS